MPANRDTIAIEYIFSDKDIHFTGSLAEDAFETEDLDFPSDWGTLEINECVIEGVSIQSDQNLEWDIVLWGKVAAEDTDLDIDEFVHFFNFPKTNGKQIAGTAQYYYPFPNNLVSIPYKDNNLSQKLHVSLVNKSVTSKNAGATGEVKIKFALRPIYGV